MYQWFRDRACTHVYVSEGRFTRPIEVEGRNGRYHGCWRRYYSPAVRYGLEVKGQRPCVRPAEVLTTIVTIVCNNVRVRAKKVIEVTGRKFVSQRAEEQYSGILNNGSIKNSSRDAKKYVTAK